MLFTNMTGSNDCPKYMKLDVLAFLYRSACVFGGLFVAFWFLQICLSFANALQDVRKFEHTGNFPYFLYYLREYQFTETVCVFLLMLTELLLYAVHCHRAMVGKRQEGIIWYFTIMLVFHSAIWLSANLLPNPEWPYAVTDELVMYYCFVANTTVLPSIVYFILYLLHVQKSELKKNM